MLCLFIMCKVVIYIIFLQPYKIIIIKVLKIENKDGKIFPLIDKLKIVMRIRQVENVF